MHAVLRSSWKKVRNQWERRVDNIDPIENVLKVMGYSITSRINYDVIKPDHWYQAQCCLGNLVKEEIFFCVGGY